MVGDNSVSFSNPPLDEVVLGVQFNASPAYNATSSGRVWDLFRSEFPVVLEQPPIPPQIEVFGGNPFPTFELNFEPSAPRPRLWFVSSDDSHLLQHQEDRLLLNWRNRRSGSPYPRHQKMFSQFRNSLEALNEYHSAELDGPLSITQAEVSYLNVFPMQEGSEPYDWIKLIDTREIPGVEQLAFQMAAVLEDEDRQPIGRCHYEVQTVISTDRTQFGLRFSLTCRGKPAGETIEDAMNFITYGRQRIVDDFCRLTTEEAQRSWGRT